MKWKPIETALKNGQSVLCFVPNRGPTILRWEDREDSWCADIHSFVVFPDGDGPTHWMPLPDPPSEAANEAGRENRNPDPDPTHQGSE